MSSGRQSTSEGSATTCMSVIVSASAGDSSRSPCSRSASNARPRNGYDVSTMLRQTSGHDAADRTRAVHHVLHAHSIASARNSSATSE